MGNRHQRSLLATLTLRTIRRTWPILLLILATTAPVIAARLATVIQNSSHRQVTDAFLPLPPAEDGSIVVTLSGDRPISLATPDPDFVRVDDHTFTTRFPWNWTGPRTVTFVDDLAEETTVMVTPTLARPFTPLDHDIPVLHITCDSTSLWDPETGIYTTGNYTNFEQRGGAWEREARFEYFLPGVGRVIDEPIGLRIHGGFSRNYYQKGLRYYFDDYGTGDFLDYPLFDTGPTRFERLIVRTSRFDDSCINANFADGLFGDLGHLVSRYRFVAVYLNREYWGAYSLRERLDDEFFETTWGLDFGGLNLIKDGETKEGDATGWWDFLANFGAVADPEDDQWFATVRQNMDLASYIDWQIINLYCVSGDNGFAWNLALFQSGDRPWRFVMWDEDLLLRSADLNANTFRFLTARNETEWNRYRAPADTRSWNAADQQWLTMFRTLLGNGEFRSLFRSRLEHLLGDAMSTANLTARIDALAAAQTPEIPAHAARWEGFRTDWYDSYVVRTKQWLVDRRPIFLAQADSFYSEFSLPPWSGDYSGLVINEFLASNDTHGQDETGDHDDWIELYNNGTATIDLSGVYLTDDLTRTRQWEFPAVLLPAGERLIVWCDDEAGQGPLHASFKLSAGGEEIGLFAPTEFGNVALDTYVFGQQTADISEGRAGDGDPVWTFMNPPTFNSTNGDTSHIPGDVPAVAALGHNYPNPFNPGTRLDYSLPAEGRIRISVFDVRGRLVRVLVDMTRPAGDYYAEWRGIDRNGRRVPSGLYIAKMEFNGTVRTRTMTLVR